MALHNFWQLLAGLAIFLYGMFLLEEVLKQLDGRALKVFLKKNTSNKLSAIFSGTIVTAILQSSSIVILMVLSLVGAEIIVMDNALGIILGANIGGTFNSWIVALLGFKIDFENFTFPIIGIAGLGLLIFANNKTIYQISKFFMGLGLLFLGLIFMKESMDGLVKNFDFKPYLSYHKIIFVLIGFIITALIQISAATVVIVLSAISTGILPLETGIAVVIGAELGTTIKILIGSIGGITAKKRIAMANFLFNLFIATLGFIFLLPIISALKNFIGIDDPLFILVAFHTLINVVGVILFFPFIKSFGQLLEKIFKEKKIRSTYYIQNASPQITDTAIDVLEKEILLLIRRVIIINTEVFHLEVMNEKTIKEEHNLPYEKKYYNIKLSEGEILSFHSKMREGKISEEDFARINQLISSLRNAMYSAKGIKDIQQDRKDFRNSVNNIKYDEYKLMKSQLLQFYTQASEILQEENKDICLEKLSTLITQIRKDYNLRMSGLYNQSKINTLEEIDVSTLLNVNRELYSSCKAMVYAIKDFKLDANRAESFNNISLV